MGGQRKKLKQFRYVSGWGKREQARDVIRKVWKKKMATEDVWRTVTRNLECSKRGLIGWNK
jgi:ribosomal protein L31E